ncbi:MAG: hypothetical protein JEZ02_00890 [Desulfatibacillum sp.]|nr:hypothetical protein [Desulfatibacillum sp.]
MNRYEINQKVKTSLVRNAVDLTQVNYSCTTTTVHIWGLLKKDPEGDFSPAGVELLLKELSRIPEVRRLQVDLDNWDVQKGDGAWVATGTKKRAERKPDAVQARVLGAGTEKTLVVDKRENIENVLKDLDKKKKDVSS